MRRILHRSVEAVLTVPFIEKVLVVCFDEGTYQAYSAQKNIGMVHSFKLNF
jgi:2-C-methyl-D-erythritol 4-phosphate cytidylyltransferase